MNCVWTLREATSPEVDPTVRTNSANEIRLITSHQNDLAFRLDGCFANKEASLEVLQKQTTYVIQIKTHLEYSRKQCGAPVKSSIQSFHIVRNDVNSRLEN